ncbi:hypothetical protein Q4E93_13135 [Flavitalea sp. BT771]|uniref:hypothetical protein n=1 Tax=Flavitalea sp. BT771 TaxID=3063329 RepID=UPI0026E3F938|nr:hypothetical protein [Flavitalea sp. BT771]MDO6431542.1 hypothetical protein [Flavitalea sp. BT771]MDV6220450.1 hypothetical protein [Flavitalea sp. BT771]
MNKIFDGVSVAGLINPGHLYILDASGNREGFPKSIAYMYCIREEKEILPALDMEFSIILAEEYELKKFLGIRKISNDCYVFEVLCYEKQLKEKFKRLLYLHRIQSFEEYLAKMKKLYKVGDE